MLGSNLIVVYNGLNNILLSVCFTDQDLNHL